MLTGIHFILTYTCNFECDHCFLYCSPKANGTFTIRQITEVLEEAQRISTVDWIYLEGGEPTLFFPLLCEGVKRSKERGFKTGVVTNAYGAQSDEDAELWLRPLAQAGLTHLVLSNDLFHYGEELNNPATIASVVAKRLGIETSSICIESPKVMEPLAGDENKGQPVVGGSAKFRGRAVEKLTDDLPRRPWQELCECPYESLESPSRVHVDSYGTVHICQGISMGNMWATPLSELVKKYRSDSHPICNPLVKGGPAELARALSVAPEKSDTGYIDECHFCYLLRKEVVEAFPDYLAPRQVYGLD